MSTHKQISLTLKKILAKIRWDKRVSCADIKLYGDSSSVFVSGVVDSELKKSVILNHISMTTGVVFYQEDIKVRKKMNIADNELLSKLRILLRNIALEPTEKIEVTIKNGKVKLEGIVHLALKKAEAVSYAWELSGMRDCDNRILLTDHGFPIPSRKYFRSYFVPLKNRLTQQGGLMGTGERPPIMG